MCLTCISESQIQANKLTHRAQQTRVPFDFLIEQPKEFLDSIALDRDIEDPFSKDFLKGKTLQEMRQIIKEQMNNKGYKKMNESGSIYMIAGENVDICELAGTNIFMVGTGSERWMIDGCKKDHPQFLDNVMQFLTEQKCTIKGILVTHAHFDHMDGVQQLTEHLELNGH